MLGHSGICQKIGRRAGGSIDVLIESRILMMKSRVYDLIYVLSNAGLTSIRKDKLINVERIRH